MTATRILINGGSGRMGQALLRLASSDPTLRIAAAVSRESHASTSAQEFAHVVWLDAAQIDGAPDFDVMIDFSLPHAFDRALAVCQSRGAGFISGTTGVSADQMSVLADAAKVIPALWAANFSLGVAVLRSLVQRAAESLPQWDIDIVEQHHTRKLDAPSGTALALADSVTAGGARVPHFHSIRAGDVVGEHSVLFSGIGERLELIHRATDRDVFARGALFAARWLAKRSPGLYRLEDALRRPSS